jgi:hypothetical protein
MTISIQKSGVWRSIPTISIWKSGAFHNVTNGWIQKAGVWYKFFQYLNVQLFDTTGNRVSTSPTNALSSFQLNADGSAYSTNVAGTLINRFAWLLGGTVASFEAALTYLSGDALTSGPGSGSFVNLGSSQQWNLNNTVISTKTYTGRCDIRPAGGGTVLATCTITITATKSA